ncbi:MAG TPA: tRNA (adenosine(37)-N6)-threonylcarbamoyltransferase complex dimerization subunit type 1 TsaB [Pseudomonadales bacterium]|jgi:tRNA threonylcarbamoyladenosine biosynthesis protein TsaB|nr:tRNA (adenosine(37)-N6)-threonylcarbamoyltransferase complex dimerization subunit type 1 TsaB [Pseudomonadales bacterium]
MEQQPVHGREAHLGAQAPTVLAIETSTAACSIALSVRGIVHEDHRVVPRQHNRLVLPMIDALLRVHDVDKRSLDAVAFGRGPGSFTGVRIAASIAQGISLGLSIPVVPISSLAALAQTAMTTRPDVQRVLATIRARPDEIYYASYVRDGALSVSSGEERIATASDHALPSGIDSTWWVVGDGVLHYADALVERRCTIDATLLPTACGVLQLALRAYEGGDVVGAADALPVYLQGTRPWRKLAE